MKAAPALWKRIFLTNPSFWLVESEFMSIGSSIILFTAFFLLMETIISCKLSFLWVKIRISLNNNFPLDGKKLAAFPEKRTLAGEFSTIFFYFHCCLKIWKKMVFTSQRISYITLKSGFQ